MKMFVLAAWEAERDPRRASGAAGADESAAGGPLAMAETEGAYAPEEMSDRQSAEDWRARRILRRESRT